MIPMLKTELLEIIANGRNSGIELTRDNIEPEQLAKDVVALVNFQGGRVLLGVDDDGGISGLQRENTEEWVKNVITEKVYPIVLPFYEEMRINEKVVAVLTFSHGNSKPYVRRHKKSEEVFIRVGSHSRLATLEQMKRLYEIVGILHTELLPVPQTSSNDLDLVRIENYLKDIVHDPELPQSEQEWEQRLANLGLLVEPDGMCTIAGIVLFGKQPRQHFKQSGLRILAFNNTEKEYKAELDTILDGPLVGGWDFSEGNKSQIDEGLIEKFIQQIDPFISEEADHIDDGLRREKKYYYPVNAIRELVINALVHRDWTRFVEIEIAVYSDRLEIISPGSLHNSMTVDKMKAGHRHTRNQTIRDIMRDYGYMDSHGMGIRTKVIPEMKKWNGKEPVFEATEDYLKITLPKREDIE